MFPVNLTYLASEYISNSDLDLGASLVEAGVKAGHRTRRRLWLSCVGAISGDLLSLKGQRVESEAVKPEQYSRAERWTGRVERTFQLPIPVQTDRYERAIAMAS